MGMLVVLTLVTGSLRNFIPRLSGGFSSRPVSGLPELKTCSSLLRSNLSQAALRPATGVCGDGWHGHGSGKGYVSRRVHAGRFNARG